MSVVDFPHPYIGLLAICEQIVDGVVINWICHRWNKSLSILCSSPLKHRFKDSPFNVRRLPSGRLTRRSNRWRIEVHVPVKGAFAPYRSRSARRSLTTTYFQPGDRESHGNRPPQPPTSVKAADTPSHLQPRVASRSTISSTTPRDASSNQHTASNSKRVSQRNLIKYYFSEFSGITCD